jgi:hypothetical protein
VVTIVRLRELGFADSAVGKRVATGRLHRMYRGVYAVGHLGVSQEARWMAAVLMAGEGAALSHLAAAELWRIWRRRVTGIDVVTPHQRSSRPGLRIHRCRRLDPRDVTVWHNIPVTTVARTLVDLTDQLDEHQLANVITKPRFASGLMSERPGWRDSARTVAATSTAWTLPLMPMPKAAPAPAASWRTISSPSSTTPGCRSPS